MALLYVQPERLDVAIESAADTLLAICAVQTGTDPMRAVSRALAAIAHVHARAEAEHIAAGEH